MRRCNLAGRFALLFTLAAVLLTAGCGSDMPFGLVPVHGKVTYDDGSLIEADKIVVTFNPIDPQRDGNMVAPGGQTEVNVKDGTFEAVSSRKPNDGVVVGKHKVVVISYTNRDGAMPVPNTLVPPQYHRESTTPLEVEVTSRNQNIELQVSKS